jgi:AcrR family transcriptional regulator
VTQVSTRPTPTAQGGRRALNRARTTRELAAAAWEILREEGFDAVTAEAVAERAGVSRRTFFNYFPRVEMVLQESVRGTIADLVVRFHARPADEPLQASLAAVLDEPFGDDVLEQAAVIFAAARTSAAARHYLQDARDVEVAQIAEALAQRIGPDAEPLRVAVVAEALVAAGHRACEAWVEQAGGVVDDRTRTLQIRLLREAFDHLATAFAPRES